MIFQCISTNKIINLTTSYINENRELLKSGQTFTLWFDYLSEKVKKKKKKSASQSSTKIARLQFKR